MLKLVKRPKSPNWVMRGTVRGVSIEESTGVADRKAAEEILTKRQAEILKESVWGKTATITFAHAVADYLEYGAGNKRFLEPLLKHFRTTLLREIDQHAIDLAAKKLYPKAGPATRNRQVFTPASAVLRHAARKGWCATPTLARPKQPKGIVRWLKPDQAERLIEASARHLRPLVIFLLGTGARVGEALWLDWVNLDLDKRQVTFPKTKNGEARSVPLHSRVVVALAALPHRNGEVFRTDEFSSASRTLMHETGVVGHPGGSFSGEGKPYARPTREADTSAGSRIHTAFASACRRAGIADFRVHDCRHTWASWHYQANRDLATLQALGGWKTVSMVLRYAHTNVALYAQSVENLPWGKSGEAAQKVAVNE